MEIYSDNDINPEAKKLCIIIAFFCFIPFQIGFTLSSEYYLPNLFCWTVLFLTCFITLYFLTSYGARLFTKRIEFIINMLFYNILNISMLIINPVITSSKIAFDTDFYMFTFLVISITTGFFVGAFFSDKTKIFNKKYMIIRENEIELRKVDMFGALSLNRMPFLRAPLIKMRNALYIVAFFIGTGGAGIGMGIAEMLKRSDVISPEVGVHSVLFFCLGMPVLFTFGILIYSMVTYLFEWRKLVARIEREYGEHKIIFNSQKKSYKKIREILDNQSSEQEKVNE